MKKMILTMVCLMMMGIQSVKAQTTLTAPAMPAELTVADGLECYLYNVGAERFWDDTYSGNNLSFAVGNYGAKFRLSVVNDTLYTLFRLTDNNYMTASKGYMSRTTSENSSSNRYRIKKTTTGYTIQRDYNYDGTQYLGTRSGKATIGDTITAGGNIVWKLLPATEATELYMAQAHLYRALVSASAYSTDLYSEKLAVYDNSSSTAAELTAAANTLDKAVALTRKLSWGGDYQMFFEDDPNHVWSYNSSDGYLDYSGSNDNGVRQVLTATVIVDQDATVRYQVSNYNSYTYNYYRGNMTLFVDGKEVRTVNRYELDRNGFFCNELTKGKHVLQWVFDYTGTDYAYFYVRSVVTHATPLITVSLPEAGSLGTEVLKQLDNMSDVRRIKISGKMNADDFARIDMMTQLFSIDMSETDVTVIPVEQFSRYSKGANKSYLHKIVLPNKLEVISDKAFDHTYADEIVFPSTLKSIGEWAFSTSRIQQAILPDGVTSISPSAFYGCRSLTKVHFPTGTKTVPNDCFYENFQLSDVELPEGLTAINSEAFYRCYPLDITIPSTVTSIGYRAFYDANLDTLELVSTASIGEYAFQYNALKRVVLSERTTVGQYAFSDNKLEYVEFPTSFYTVGGARNLLANNPTLKTLMLKSPTVIIGDELSSLLSGSGTSMAIKVPDYLVSAYKLATYWNGYSANIEGFSTAEVDSWRISQPLTLRSNERFEGSPSILITDGGSLTVNGETAMNINDFGWFRNLNNHWSPYSSFTAMVLSNCENIKISGKVHERSATTANRWYFLCLPFNFKVSDIVPEGGAKYAIRYYDGASRAANQANTGNWKDLPADTIVTAGTGFIYQTSKDEYTNFYAIDDADKQNIMGNHEFAKQLNSNYSENPAHSGWNLVGNPYLTYYNIHKLNFTAPITVPVRDPSSLAINYKAYSIIDDDYAIKPLETLFVQCPDEINTITFPTAGRQLTDVIESQNAAPTLRAQTVQRQLVDLELSDGETADQTRVVFNSQASIDYETSCDASKFTCDDNRLAQLYTLDNNGIRYAINERPAQDGTVRLGLYIPTDGSYTLKVARNREAGQILLKDLENGSVTDITDVAYSFRAEAGTLDNRFLLLSAELTGILDVAKTKGDAGTTEVYDLSGRKLEQGAQRGGIYVIRQNGQTRKVSVK